MSDITSEGEGLKRTLKDLTAGAAGGIAQVLLGQSKPLSVFPRALICQRLRGDLQLSKYFLLLELIACVWIRASIHYRNN